MPIQSYIYISVVHWGYALRECVYIYILLAMYLGQNSSVVETKIRLLPPAVKEPRQSPYMDTVDKEPLHCDLLLLPVSGKKLKVLEE